jgi:adenylate cyclase class 2
MEERLRSLGARLIQSQVRETNLRFDTPDGALSRRGAVLRLRLDSAARLTFKGEARVREGALDRQEIEFSVGDFESAQRLLEAIGYEVVFVYEKIRTVYQFGDALVMLDELPYGNFLEIESDLEDLPRLASRLGLDWKASIPAGYHDLFERARASRSLPFRDLTFENLKGIQLLPQDLGVLPAD